MSQERIRANSNNTGIIYTTSGGDEVEIPIDNFTPKMTDANDDDYHSYDETSSIPDSEYVTDKSIIERNFLEEPAPTFGLWDAAIPVSTGDVSFGFPVGNVKHYVASGPNGETIIVNVTESGQHFLSPGIVVRELYEDASGQSYINDTGVGTGLAPELNQALANGLWQGNADRIGRESVFEDINGVPPIPSNEPALPAFLKSIPPWLQDALAPLDGTFGIGRTYTSSYSPLVLDFDGSGTIDLTAFNATNVYFDFWGDGFHEKTGWVAPTDGLLALDVNGDGSIDDVSELFGSGFPLELQAANDNNLCEGLAAVNRAV